MTEGIVDLPEIDLLDRDAFAGGVPHPWLTHLRANEPVSHHKVLRVGDKIALWFVSGNRDEDVFDDPFRFDIERSPNDHIAFGGGGPHFCLGASLARLEIRVLFEELVRRVPRFTALGPPDHLRSTLISGIKHLPVDLSAP